jgi:glycosyltransferase involved in cell wall biosynthesis
VLINNTGLGGTERRLGRLFARMTMEEKETVFVLNRGLWAKLVAGDLVAPAGRCTIRLAEPFGWFANRLPRAGSLPFWVSKLDYLLMAAYVLLRYGLASPRMFHVVLGGAYVTLPLMLARRDHRYVISITDPNLSSHVGSPSALPLFRAAIRKSHAVDALTEDIAASLVEGGIEREKICCSEGSVVDLSRFRPQSEKERLVVFAGRMVNEKNPLLFLEAAPAIHRAIPEARFCLLGDGPLRARIEAEVDRLGLRSVIRTGFVEDMASILGPAMVFVSLQRRDNFPSQVLLEAMASGAATVATDVGLTSRLVDEETGIRVRPSAEEVARAVIELLSDPARCCAMGGRARQRVADMHSEERYISYLAGLYARAEAVPRRSRPSTTEEHPVSGALTKP